MNTPTFLPLVAREYPSTMWMPVISWRKIIGRIPAMAAASSSGWYGTQPMNSTPSIRRMLAIAVTPSIYLPLS